ncbi:MAG: hypothetical protein O6929_13485 [candidate division NC10 bacterium]|nr:hypothetical protein [candidate division NC10 bacterium]
MRYEIRISGDGGQGIILAEAAIEDGKNVAQTGEWDVEAVLDLTPGESEILLQGGLLNAVRARRGNPEEP